MRFQYDAEPTLHETILQVIGYGSICWTDVSEAGQFQAGKAARAGEAAIQAVRDAVTLQLSGLLDVTGTATDWNDAIEAAIRVVEGMS